MIFLPIHRESASHEKKKPLCQNRYLQLPTTSQMASGERFYGQMRQRLNCFVTMKREMFEARPGFQTEQQSTNCQYNVGSVILCRCLAASGSGT